MSVCIAVGMCECTCVAEYHRLDQDVLMATVSCKAARDEHGAMIDNKCL